MSASFADLISGALVISVCVAANPVRPVVSLALGLGCYKFLNLLERYVHVLTTV